MTTLSIIEDAPVLWPDPPIGLSTAAAALEPEVIWRRLESWMAYRWGERPCSFIVKGGCGSWRAPLAPFTTATTDVWHGEAWEPVTLAPHPLGGFAIGSGSHYRFVGTLGTADAPPEDVAEAFRRLAEFWTKRERHPGASAFTDEMASMKRVEDRAPTWLARALVYSGAADLLRPYRRAP